MTNGLFWRTFFYLSLLVTASMATWFISFKVVERKPRAQQVSGQIISVVTITRAALTHSAFDKRRELLIDLAHNEGLQVYLLEIDDKVIAPEPSVFFNELATLVRNKLGKETQFAQDVNGLSGFWVSFSIDNDQYWLRLDQERILNETGLQLLGWGAVTLIFTLLGAALISKLINDPLSRLSTAARMVAKGKRPRPLPEVGPKEILEANLSFNQMVDDLARVESDRAVILAGISHDLRTPITRMQLEIEMANLSDEARSGMQSDLSQMDGIIHQFLDYAKPIDNVQFNHFDLSALIDQVIDDFTRLHQIHCNSSITPEIIMHGNAVEMRRLLNNIFENARRYGQTANSQLTSIDIHCQYRSDDDKEGVELILRDHGEGVSEEEIPHLLRPFTRSDASRSQANGSGLGLAIVKRIVKRHHGELQVKNHPQGGLQFSIFFPKTS
jgi:two-component system osmolarity sensor histidine kinase EnvZ